MDLKESWSKIKRDTRTLQRMIDYRNKGLLDQRQIMELEKEIEEDDSECGNPGNHNNGETDNCIECAAMRLNI